MKLYFLDAVHVIYGAELGYSWCRQRPIVKSAYGRKRFNVLGALDSETNECIVVSNDSYINSVSVVKLFEKLREINGPEIEIYLILDNAKYQKCQYVFDGAENNKINLKFLPTYSPNLNLIERLWKFLRSECLANKYKGTFKEFGESILECLSQTHLKHREKLSTLLSHKFEIFKTK